MKKQPAKINYFFKGGYIELGNIIKSTFINLGSDISDAWEWLAEGFVDFWSSFFATIKNIISRDFEWSDFKNTITGIFKFSFGLGKFVCILFITTSLCVLFSLAHIFILLSVMTLVYICFVILVILDSIYRGVKKISSNCPNCQSHFLLPVYICPNCGTEHTALKPSKYGILKRTCDCGCKLPTTFFNGREKLVSHCPICGMDIKDGGKHVDICIPVVGGTNSGKTCFIHQAISEIEKNSSKYGFDCEYSSTGMDDYEDNMAIISKGALPDKTNDMRLKYYQFYLTPSNVKLKNLISLCDIGGEVYSDSMTLGSQIGFRFANAFLMIIDPLSISAFRNEVSKHTRTELYRYSSDSIDEILNRLISTLENMFNISSKDMLKTDVAVVFSKCDIPGLQDKIGAEAVEKLTKENEKLSWYDAQNIVCENFLKEYDENNFLNGLTSKFKSMQFFCSSSLGHNVDGTPFTPSGVEDPVLWLVDIISDSIDLKGKWGKKL